MLVQTKKPRFFLGLVRAGEGFASGFAVTGVIVTAEFFAHETADHRVGFAPTQTVYEVLNVFRSPSP